MWLDSEVTEQAPAQEGAQPETESKQLELTPEDDKGAGAKAKSGEKKASRGEADKSLQKRLEALEAELKAARESEKYWAELAKRYSAPQAEEGEEEEGSEEQEEPVDKFIEELSNHGLKALRKRGLVTMRDVEKLVQSALAEERKRMMADMELVRKYPELTDESSPVFARAREVYREMVERDPSLKNSPVALELAAKVAKAELAANGAGDTRSQAFERGAGRRSPGSDEGRLSDYQKKIIEKFNADGGVKITEEEYRRRASQGVNLAARAGIYRSGSMDWE
jgi:hypothetical protein